MNLPLDEVLRCEAHDTQVRNRVAAAIVIIGLSALALRALCVNCL